MENRSMRTFNRMESQWKRIVQKAQSREDTVVFPKLNDKVQAAWFVIEQTHTPDRLRGNSPGITTLSGPADYTDGTPGDDGDKNAVFHVKGIVTAVQTGERVTNRTNYGGDTINRTNLEDDKPDGLRRLTSNVVQRQQTTDEAVTFLRPPGLRRLTNDVVQRQHTTDEAVTFLRPPGLQRLTNDVVQRQHTTDEAVLFLRPLQKNHRTFQSIKKIRKSINSIGSGKWAIYYITKEGARIKGKKNLGPHINHLKNVTEENFTFQPIKLSIKDPLNKYQSIRQAGPSRRSTSRAIPQGSYQSALGDDSAQLAGEHVILQDSIDSKQLTETGVHNGTLSYKTL